MSSNLQRSKHMIYNHTQERPISETENEDNFKTSNAINDPIEIWQ